MESAFRTYLALWRKDLRANALTVLLVGAVVLVGASLSLVERWRFEATLFHVLFATPIAAFLLGTALFGTEAAGETEVYFHSLPLRRTRGLVARCALVAALLLGVLGVSVAVGGYLLRTAPVLVRLDAGMGPTELSHLPLLLPLLLATAGAAGVAIAAGTLACGLVSGSVKGARLCVGLAAVIAGVSASWVNGWFCISVVTEGGHASGRLDWVWSGVLLGAALAGALIGWRAAFIPPLEKARRAGVVLHRWSVAFVCFLGASVALNCATARTRYTDTKAVSRATAAGDRLVAEVTAVHTRRETTSRLWLIDATTGETRPLGKGLAPALHDRELLVYDPWRFLRQPAAMERRVVDLSSGTNRPLPVPAALRQAWRSGRYWNWIDAHPRSGNAVVQNETRAGFLADRYYGRSQGPPVCYRAEKAEPLRLESPDQVPLSSRVTWSSDGTALLATAGYSSRLDLAGVVEATPARQLWWVDLATSDFRLLYGPSKDFVLFPGCLARDDRQVCFFTPVRTEDPTPWNLMVSSTDAPAPRVAFEELQPPELPPKWSPEGSRLAFLSGDRYTGKWTLRIWDRETGENQTVPLDLLSAPMRFLWRVAGNTQARSAEDMCRGSLCEVKQMAWSSDGERFAFAVREAGCIEPALIERGDYRERVRLSVHVVGLGERTDTVTGVLEDTTHNRWSLAWSEVPDVEALVWTRDGEVACLLHDGRLLKADPADGKVRVAIRTGGGA